ncbi:NAD(P)-binding domain-containing protein [Streptomyces sp. CLV115]|uniref:NAD(P)-binding domain-containing protein n=1 Tax=Streptomyces sp. CLV115 TaxID=3138502 RepID=UPI00313DCB4E
MKRIGVIGVGEIGRALVEGLCDAAGPTPEVFLSPRGARTAAGLSERFDGVHVCVDNQQVVDRADLIVVAVRRQDRHEALNGLRVDGGKVVVNVMAGVSNDDLRGMLATDAPLVRAIPLPSVRERRSVTVTHPAHPAADHETPAGNNERIRTTWFDHTNAATLDNALDGLLTDLRSRQDPSTEPAAEQKTEQEKTQEADAAQRRRPPART